MKGFACLDEQEGWRGEGGVFCALGEGDLDGGDVVGRLLIFQACSLLGVVLSKVMVGLS